MHLLRSRHAPILLSLGLFGLLVWWTNTPKRPYSDPWLAEISGATPWELDLEAAMAIDGLAYDHLSVADTLSHHLGLLAMALPHVRQDWRLDACCPGAENGTDIRYRASLKLHFPSMEGRSAFLLGLQQLEQLSLGERHALADGVTGHAALTLDMPGRPAQLLIPDVNFRVRHGSGLPLS